MAIRHTPITSDSSRLCRLIFSTTDDPGNERHGDHKQYAHKIPRKVREFCDRWEREVLTPWFAAQRTGAERPAKKKQKAGRIA